VASDERVRQERRFLKPLRFESKRGAAFPNAMLLDRGDVETPLDILTPFMSDRDRAMKQRAIDKRAVAGWVGDMLAQQELPPLPRAATVQNGQRIPRVVPAVTAADFARLRRRGSSG